MKDAPNHFQDQFSRTVAKHGKEFGLMMSMLVFAVNEEAVDINLLIQADMPHEVRDMLLEAMEARLAEIRKTYSAERN